MNGDRLMEKEKVTKSIEKIVTMISKLEAPEFIGVCKILNIEVYDVKSEQVLAAEPTSEKTELNPESVEGSDGRETTTETKDENQARNTNVEVRPAETLIEEVIDKILTLNRTQRRNLEKLLRAAVKGR